MRLTLVCIAAFIVFAAVNLHADVPLPGVSMPEKVKAVFAEIAQDYPNGNLARILQAKKQARQNGLPRAQSETLYFNVPLLLGTYSNTSATHSATAFQNQIFADNPTGTMIDYYREVSYGQFELSGQTYGWYKNPQTQAFYHSLEADGARFTLDLVKLADADVDFSQFDADGDGYVDVVMVVHTGAGAETGENNNIWSHRWSLNAARGARPSDMPQGEYTTNDARPGYAGQFMKINDYIIQPETSGPSDGSIVDIGVFCHEFGHALGLPDLYDTDNSSEGIGQWGLMASGSYGGDGRHSESPTHMCPWSKAFLGWIDPPVIDSDTLEREILNSAQHSDQIFKIQTNGAAGPEYFLIENRQPVGYDKYILGSGLLVWHIDEDVIAERGPSNSVNNNENRKGVDLEEADGLADLDRAVNRGDAGDPFPGLTRNYLFNSSSNPNSIKNDGDDSNVAIQIGDVVDQIVRIKLLLTPELVVDAPERFVAYSSGSLQFKVSNRGGGQMNWTATSSAPWLTITSGAGGVNQGTIKATFAENTSPTGRVGQITVAVANSDESQELTVTQTGFGEWRLLLHVADKGGENAQLQLGQLSAATDHLDPHLGEAQLSPRPAKGIFDARLVSPLDEEMTTLYDFRAMATEWLEWRITFQPGSGGMPITLTWDPLNLPSGSFFARDEITGTLISVDMRQQSEISIPTPFMTSLRILHAPGEPQLVETTGGWDLISLPFQQANMVARRLFPTAISSAFVYENNRYAPVDTLVNGRAYWLKFGNPVDYAMFGPSITADIPLSSGWNMIGPFDRTIRVAEILTEPAAIIASDFYDFATGYVKADSLEPGKGYWVMASQAGRILGNTVPAMQADARDYKTAGYSLKTSLSKNKAIQSAVVDIPIVVRDAEGSSTTLWLGLDPAASPEIDGLLGEMELPPLPPARTFDARFINADNTNLGEGSYRDYRRGDDNFSGTTSHLLRFQSFKNSRVTIAWDLPANVTGHIADVRDTHIVNKEMRGAGEVSVSMVNVIDRLQMTLTYAATPAIAVLSPNGGEVLEIGSQVDLTWNSTNVNGNVNLFLSRDGGANFNLLATAANTGVFPWTVTGPASSDCRLRITSADGLILDESDATFRIDFADGVATDNPLPTEFALYQNYPNPFNPTTTIRYDAPKTGQVRLVILNSLGQVIRILADETRAAGSYTVLWDGHDDRGNAVASGLFFCKMTAGDFVAARKMVYMR